MQVNWELLGSVLSGLVAGGGAALALLRFIIRAEFNGFLDRLDSRYYSREMGEVVERRLEAVEARK